MKRRVVVWGTGNVGRPAIRAVASHRQLELTGVIVANPAKVGRDAGDLAGLPALGISATRDWQSLLEKGADAVIYTATGDTRPDDAINDIVACLEAGCNVLSTSCYALLHPSTTPEALRQRIDAACEKGGSSILVSGIDPGWALDILPLMLSGVVADISEIRCQEIFNYALYDQPDVVRHIIGFGTAMDETPPMLYDFSLKMVWEPMVRMLGDALGIPVEEVRTLVEKRPLEKDIEVEGMGRFEKGSQGAFRFEVQGLVAGRPLFVAEHITRIDSDCAPDWPYPPEGEGCHKVIISGSPNLQVSLHAQDPLENGPAAGGNATAANRLVNAVPALCAAAPGMLSAIDLPLVDGADQIRQ